MLKERSDYKSSGGTTPTKLPSTTEHVVDGSEVFDPTTATQETTSTNQSQVSFGGAKRESVFLSRVA